MIEHVDVAVIGGGVTGLAAAWGAERKGASAAVLEASSECGGVIGSAIADGFLVERGATSMAGTPATMLLLRELGLHSEIIEPPAASKRRYVVRDGKMCALPSSPLGLVRTPVLSFAAKWRALMEPLVRRSAQSGTSESLQQLVQRRLGREVLDYVVDPFVSGVYAGDPQQLSSRYALSMLNELEQRHGSIVLGGIKSARAKAKASQKSATHDERHPHILSFHDGMQRLPRAIESALARPVQTHTRVTEVRRDGERWLLTSHRNGARTQLRANSLVVAVAAHQARGISWPDGFDSALRVVGDIRHAPIATVALGYRAADITHALDGFGVLMPHVEQRRALGVLFSSTMFSGRAPDGTVLLTAFVGGARFRGELDGARAATLAREEVAALLAPNARPVFELHHVWPLGIPQYNLGHEAVEAALAELESANPGLIVAGSYRTGVAVGQCLVMGVDAGQRAAGSSSRLHNETFDFLTAEGPIGTDETSSACVDPSATHFSGLYSRRTT